MRRAELRRRCDQLHTGLQLRQQTMRTAWQRGGQALASLGAQPGLWLLAAVLAGVALGHPRGRQGLMRLRPLLGPLLRLLRSRLAQDPPAGEGTAPG